MSTQLKDHISGS